MTAFWIVFGAATGVAHATALWRYAQRGSVVSAIAAVRLPALAVLFVIAALAGRLLPVALAWAAGLAGTCVVLLRRPRWR